MSIEGFITIEEKPHSAEETLERLEEIAKRGRLKPGHYAILRAGEREPDAPCGGTNACMIGATWLAAGVGYCLPENADTPGTGARYSVEIPGVQQYERRDFLRERPELTRALAALNAAADERIGVLIDLNDGRGIGLYDSIDSIESLFESVWAQGLTQYELCQEMLLVIQRAKTHL